MDCILFIFISLWISGYKKKPTSSLSGNRSQSGCASCEHLQLNHALLANTPTTVVWYNSRLVQQSFGTPVVWYNSRLVQQSFGTTVVWYASRLVQQSFGTTVVWYTSRLVHQYTHLFLSLISKGSSTLTCAYTP